MTRKPSSRPIPTRRSLLTSGRTGNNTYVDAIGQLKIKPAIIAIPSVADCTKAGWAGVAAVTVALIRSFPCVLPLPLSSLKRITSHRQTGQL